MSDPSRLTPAERARYARHLTLAEIGEAGQARLRDGSVAVIGAGGLGSPCLLYLAAAGVGRIGIVDDDRVDESNLQRQVLHGTARLGDPKAASAHDRLSDLNPLVQLDVHEVRLSPDNALELLAPYDVVVDGTDNFSSRYLINDACEILGKPLVYGAIQRFEGQLSVFNHRGGPTYRDLFPEPPPPELAPNCAEAGVLGVLPGIIGTLQAVEVVKLLLGRDDVMSGRILLYDALAVRFDELGLARDPGRTPVTDLSLVEALCAAPTWQRLDARTLRTRLDEGWRPTILDVRTPAEQAAGALSETTHRVPHTKVRSVVADLPADGPIVVLCRSGGRSSSAARALADAGVDPGRLFDLEGGLLAYKRDVDPTLEVITP